MTNQTDTDSSVHEDELDEKLVGGQKKLDRNKNGKIDATDFAMLRKGNQAEETDESYGTAGIPPAQGATLESALQGQYGHSGKLKPIGESPDFLTRLKELSGMIRS